MFIEHIKINIQHAKFHDPYPQKAGFIMAGKMIDWGKYGGLRPKPPLFPP